MAPAQVIEVDGGECVAAIGGRTERASTLLEPSLRVGDWVLITAGTVVRRLDAEQAAEMSAAVLLVDGWADSETTASVDA
jgi:hydrogenase maturation factor